ncbi:MAG: segregation/condensation protein A [Deltaproteobacteria bacterium]|jgi:segregation and condensation protein A|nr:segregation/condensation protein A [Deltaproteobacteria bacterium]
MGDELTLRLDIYQGPLDLLLHLIKKNEVGIQDIPVSLITAQYIEYLDRMMDDLDLEAAGDFLIMASTLTHIKSRMLLPPEEREAGKELEDPRLEIVKPLLEYAACQAAAEALAQKPQLERDVFSRGGKSSDILPEMAQVESQGREVAKGSLMDLLEAWRDLFGRKAFQEAAISFTMETKTIAQKLEEIRLFLIEARSASFSDLIGPSAGNFELSLCFLAILELARTGFMRLHQDLEEERSVPRLYLADPEAGKLVPESLDYR